MSQDRLCDLVLMSIEREETEKTDFDEIINDFGYIVTSPMATLFRGAGRIFCSLITTVASFLYNLRCNCKLGYVEPPHGSLFTNRNTFDWPIVEPKPTFWQSLLTQHATHAISSLVVGLQCVTIRDVVLTKKVWERTQKHGHFKTASN